MRRMGTVTWLMGRERMMNGRSLLRLHPLEQNALRGKRSVRRRKRKEERTGYGGGREGGSE